MANEPQKTITGTVHGKTIELDRESGLPDGQQVSVVVQPLSSLPPGEGLRRAFGAWAEDGEELDRFLEQLRRDRNVERPGPSAVTYLVDSDICSAYLKGNGRVFNRFTQHMGQLCVSALTVGELYTWASRANSGADRPRGIANMLLDVPVLKVDTEIALEFGTLRGSLLDRGIVVPTVDLFISVTALVHGLIVVTHNRNDFSRVPGLQLEDWIKP